MFDLLQSYGFGAEPPPEIDCGSGHAKGRPLSRRRPAKGAHAKKHKAAKMKKASRRRNRRGV